MHALAGAVAEQQAAVGRLPADVLSAHRELAVRALAGRGDVELWLGRFDDAEKAYTEAAALPVPAAAAADPIAIDQTAVDQTAVDQTAVDQTAAEQAGCLGRIALAMALNGKLIRAAEFAAKAAAASAAAAEPGPGGEDCPAGAEPPLNVPADLALALVHLEQYDLARARGSLRRVDAGLRARPDRMAAALARLVASWLCLAEGRYEGALGMLSHTRQDWAPPGWLDCRLTLAEARAEVLAGRPLAALRLVGRCDAMPRLDAATARSYAWVAADDLAAARRELRRAFDVTAAEAGPLGGPRHARRPAHRCPRALRQR